VPTGICGYVVADARVRDGWLVELCPGERQFTDGDPDPPAPIESGSIPDIGSRAALAGLSQCGRKAADVVAVARPRPRGVPKNPTGQCWISGQFGAKCSMSKGGRNRRLPMPAPYHAEEKFHEALRALIGPAPQRKRLENAYLDHLSDLQDAELPVSQRAKFVQLRETLTHGKQLDPEIVIEAMNDDEVAEAARQILTLYDGIMDAARSGPSPK
jgi:hypothetical protein